jgi:hypothetical protein
MPASNLSQVSKYADSWTVVAIAIVATVCADMIHEGLGHGGMCLLTGGHPRLLTTVNFECHGEGLLVAAGGTLANVIAGAIFWATSRLATRSTRLRYFLWLSMTINLFAAGGYFLFSGIGNIGDWAVVIQGLQPQWAWRVGLTILGVISYGLVMWLALVELGPFIGRDLRERVLLARRLTVLPYFTDGILSCLAGMLNPVGMILVAISAAAASFGGGSGLAWMWQWLRGPHISAAEFQMPPLERSRAWIFSAAILAVLFIAVLGRGVRFDAR